MINGKLRDSNDYGNAALAYQIYANNVNMRIYTMPKKYYNN